MNPMLQQIVGRIDELNPIHAKKIRKTLDQFDEGYFKKVGQFLVKYNKLLTDRGKDLNYGVDCYLRMCGEMMYEQLRFRETGKYSSTSFDEVNARVYNNPEVMEYYMYGLILSDFLWAHHYRVHSFFVNHLGAYKSQIKDYLEIGGGIGLGISEAIHILNDDVSFDLVDISPSSIEISKAFVVNNRVSYFLQDIFEFDPERKYNFITMGEVLEHVEEPVELLSRVRDLLHEDGHAFITVPANAPTIDHIYLFTNAQDIRDVIHAAGLEIVDEISVYAENVTEAKAIKYKVALMYGAFLRKK